MKKKLESELISVAHRILKLKGKEDVIKMYAEASVLLEKLSVLKFAHENFEDDMPTIGSDSSFFGMLDQAFNNTLSDTIEVEDKIYINLDEVEDDAIMEPVMEKIKNMFAEMPQETEDLEDLFDDETSKNKYDKNDLENITADFKDMPVFEPISKGHNGISDAKKSLNDRLKNKSLNIGLNDKLAFIKHLFEGKAKDYERVMSQINTLGDFMEVTNLIQNIVKPDYNNWVDKEEFEARFMEIIESKFDS